MQKDSRWSEANASEELRMEWMRVFWCVVVLFGSFGLMSRTAGKCGLGIINCTYLPTYLAMPEAAATTTCH